jgi:hypothetical protein
LSLQKSQGTKLEKAKYEFMQELGIFPGNSDTKTTKETKKSKVYQNKK